MAELTDEVITGPNEPQTMTFAKSTIPFFGALVDYIVIGFHYFRSKSFTSAEKLHRKCSKSTLSASFLAAVCLVLGFVANIKLEAVRYDGKPLNYDLHFMLMSKKDNIYLDEIDPSRVTWCLEASDCVALLISCLLVWGSTYAKSPMREYLFLPWFGVTLRGLILRQIPTVSALVYVMATVDREHVDILFLTAASFLFLLEARVCVELARIVRARWERRGFEGAPAHSKLQTLWSSEDDDELSVEVRNFVY